MLYDEFIKQRTLVIPEPTKIVSDVESIRSAIENAANGDVIGISPGVYNVSEPKLIFRNKQNVILRSVSGNCEDVIFEGSGFHKKDGYRNTYCDELVTVTDGSRGITIHGITFRESTCHGVKIAGEGNVSDITVDGCKFINICERMIKGSRGDQGYRVGGMIITNNWFENTKIPVETDHMAEFTGDYIAGIDMMVLDDAIVSGNTFKNIKGAHGGARGAIFLWVQSKNLTAERNVIINCDRGICFGNPSGSGELHVDGGLIADNMIVETTNQSVELAWTNNIKVRGNLICKSDINGRGIEDTAVEKSKNILIEKNIVHASLNVPLAVLSGNRKNIWED